ncbi:FecR family protein [Pedobacter sp. N23S346]|uniref:FecR family protein n=1 Tax=Pedobacter sp. N23S346 TaxID=3402750 RepID=UPI003ACD9F92
MKDEIWNHIVKRLSHTETSTSKKELDLWLAEDSDNKRKYQESAMLWHLTGKLKSEETFEIPDLKADSISANSRPKQQYYWAYGMAAACIAALFIFGLNFINNNKQKRVTEWTIQTASPGKILSVTLPDRSTVMLNSGSSIRYQKDFLKNNNRLVQLSGEAFFDVRHQRKQPFVVESGKIKTVVYGTSFNIRAYKSESHIQVSVTSGKVGVLKNEDKSKPIFLLPHNSLTFDTLAKTFSKVLTSMATAEDWRNGSLIFEQTPIMEVLATLSRRFNVEFDTTAYKHPSCKLTARFEHKDLAAILKTIQTVMNIEIKKIDQTIYLKGGNACKEN